MTTLLSARILGLAIHCPDGIYHLATLPYKAKQHSFIKRIQENGCLQSTLLLTATHFDGSILFQTALV